MIIASKTGEQLNFLETGVEGIYVLDHVAFEDKFDEEGNNDWKDSSGNRKLQWWAENTIPQEILEQFDVDLPAVEEVFSQKMLNLYIFGRKLKSKQFPIFQSRVNRMKKFEGKPIWWWTRSAYDNYAYIVWYVYTDGSVSYDIAYDSCGFVPLLRSKRK